MRILLINPSLHQVATGQYEKDVEKERGVYPPLGLLYIASILEKHNHQVVLIDIDIEGKEAENRIKSAYQELNPEMVGFYATTWGYAQAKDLAERFKQLNPEIITVIGGPNVTSLPRESLQLGNFDFGVMSEGEETIIELIEKLEGKKNLEFEQILGLVFKKDDQIVINPPRPLIEDMDSIPFPARHLIPAKKYFDVFSRNKHFITIMATRGCPFNCLFCDRKNRLGRKWRVRSPENIAREIRQVINDYGIREFMFFDDDFIVDKNWGTKVCQELKPLNIIWECRNRVDMLDEEMLKAMKEAGCYRVRLGFESGDNHVLRVLKKGITAEQSLACAKLCQKIGIEVFGYFMMGLPEETPQAIKRTIDLALKIDPSFAIFSKTRIPPASDLFDYAVRTNQIKKDHWQKYLAEEESNGAPALSTKELSEEMVNQYLKKAIRKFYFRPGYIIKRILSVKSFRHLISQARIGFALLFK